MAEDLSRWLRAVRPPTAADEPEWTDGAGAEILASVHRRTAGRFRPMRTRAARSWLPAVTTAAAAAVVVIVAATSGGTGGTGIVPVVPAPGATNLPAVRPAAMLLDNFTSCSNLLEQFRSHAADSVTAYGLPSQSPSYFAYYDLAVGDKSGALAGSGAAGAGTSTTNVQEVGVDEPDIVKTDGDRVIALTDGVLRVVDDNSHDVTGTLDLSMYDGWQNAQLLVDGDNVLVVMSGSSGSTRYGLPAYGPAPYLDLGSTLIFVDLHGAPLVTGSMRVSGAYVDARQVGTTVRLVISSVPRISFPATKGDRTHRRTANRQVVEQAPLSAWLPTYTINQGAQSGGPPHSVPCTSVSRPAKYTAADMITVYTLDLADLGADPHPVSVAADGDTVYATATSLYVASNPDWYCCSGSGSDPTELHRFDITGSGPPTYLGSGSVPGRLLNRYSLSDYDGSLRVATTTGGEGPSSTSSVYVLDDATLKATGRVGGLGAGEQIYAVRFLGPMGYVVTYHQTDPLYVLDLHDAAAPKIAGRLDMSGFSIYLHDAGENRLLGVGDETGNEQQRLQVALYDVSTPSHPVRTGQIVDSKGYADQWSFDPHSFLYWQPTGLVAVPTSTGKVLVVKVDGAKLTQVGTIANRIDPGTTNDGQGIRRTLIVDGQLWTVSGSGVRVSDADNLDQTAWIPFPTS